MVRVDNRQRPEQHAQADLMLPDAHSIPGSRVRFLRLEVYHRGCARSRRSQLRRRHAAVQANLWPVKLYDGCQL